MTATVTLQRKLITYSFLRILRETVKSTDLLLFRGGISQIKKCIYQFIRGFGYHNYYPQFHVGSQVIWNLEDLEVYQMSVTTFLMHPFKQMLIILC